MRPRGWKPVCLARASQRLLALWHIFNHAFAGQQVTFVNGVYMDASAGCLLHGIAYN
jgi:hypothetical protein